MNIAWFDCLLLFVMYLLIGTIVVGLTKKFLGGSDDPWCQGINIWVWPINVAALLLMAVTWGPVWAVEKFVDTPFLLKYRLWRSRPKKVKTCDVCGYKK